MLFMEDDRVRWEADDLIRLVHELKQHQLETEARNGELRAMSDELARSRDEYADLYESAPVPYVTLDDRGIVRQANHAATLLFERERAAILGRYVLALGEFDAPQSMLSQLEACLRTSKPVAMNLQLAVSGGTRDFHMFATAVADSSGVPVGVRAAFVDVSALKRAERMERARATEAALRERLEELAAAHVAMSEAIAGMGDGNVTDVMQVLADRARAITNARYAAVGAGPRPVEASVVSIDMGATSVGRGRLSAIDASSLRVPIEHAGRMMGTLCLANRVGADRFSEADELAAVTLAERAAILISVAQMLRRERRRMHLLGAAGAAFAKIVEVRDTFDAIARVAVPVLGDAAAVYRFDSAGALVTRRGERADVPEDLLREIASEGRPRRFAEPPPGAALLGDGPTMFVPLVREGQQVLGILHVAFAAPQPASVVEDDLDLASEFAHRAALALENARLHERAQRALAARDALLSVVTHDLGNMLAAIRPSAGLAADSTDEAERRVRLDAIARSVQRMSAILRTLRDATMIEAGEFVVSPRPGDLRSLILEACSLLRARADVKHVDLEVRMPGDLPRVTLDAERTHQVIANILGNAIDHTPPEGRIVVQLVAREEHVRVMGSDTGPGVDANDREHVFERYWSKDHDGNGTGLGLFIAKGIVEAQGGSIGVESEAGHGATFFFTLPIAKVQPESSKASGVRPKYVRTGEASPDEKPKIA